MTLLDGEKVLLETEAGDLVVTTHRVRHGSQKSEYTSIMLEEICSVEVTRKARPWMLIAAWTLLVATLLWVARLGFLFNAAATLDAIAEYERSARRALIYGGTMSGFFFMAYFWIRYRVVVLASAGAKIEWVVERLGPDYVAGCVDQVEAARNERLLLLNRISIPKAGSPYAGDLTHP
jgi:hypothetical protein